MNIENPALFEHYLEEASQQDFAGWDFSCMKDRWIDRPPAWDYITRAGAKMERASSLLDMGTGGGECLSSFPHLPPRACATEGYAPNVRVAANRLHPLGIRVIRSDPDEKFLPFRSGAFDLVINRHESFDAHELRRVLAPGGTFITQQVGGRDNIRLNEVLQDPVGLAYADWLPERACRELEEAGFHIDDCREDFPEHGFKDLGAVLFYLKVISWQVADFSIEKYYDRLVFIHNHIQKNGILTSFSHRFYIEAHKT